ncbi:tRNA pseudouridine55 synthase [Marmoricola sp. URHA0025 HA25]
MSPDELDHRGVTGRPPAGLVVADKPAGMTSHDVVARVRRLACTRKVGHAGTLDPMATGVLVIGIDRATRMLGHLTLTEKSYEATVRLGASTTTDDAEGDVVAHTSAAAVDEESVRAALGDFEGPIMQVPSTVSAIKVGGKRAYALVRTGEEVELAARPVTVHAIELGEFSREGEFLDFRLRIRCSSGTYIRAIARDVGAALGVGGHLTALRRTAVGPFSLDLASGDLDELRVIPIADAARAAFPAVDLSGEHADDVRYGRKLDLRLGGEGPHALFAPDGEFLALYEQDGDLARAVAVFV